MQFDDLLGGDAGSLMQAIDVLGDDRAQHAPADQRSQRLVATVRLGSDEIAIDDCLAPPCFATHVGGTEEILEWDRLQARPNAPWTAKIRDTGFGTDAGTRECDRAFALGKQRSQTRNVLINDGFPLASAPIPES